MLGFRDRGAPADGVHFDKGSVMRRAIGAAILSILIAGCGGGGGGGGDATDVLGVQQCRKAVTNAFPPGANLDWDVALGGPALSSSDSAGGAFGGSDGLGGVGVAGSLGRFENARVLVRGLDGTEFGSATIGSDGLALFQSCGDSSPVLVTIKGQAGARYFDEGRGTAGAWVDLPESAVLRAWIPSLSRNIGVTPFTEAAVQWLEAQGITSPTAKQIAEANDKVRALVNAFIGDRFAIDDIARLPAILGPDSGSGSLTDDPRGRYGAVVAAFGRQAGVFNPGLSAPALQATQQLGRDLTDGVLDGFDATGAPVASASQRAYDPAALTAALSSSLASITTQFGGSGVQQKVDRVIALGAAGLPVGSSESAAPKALQLRSDGALLTADAAATRIDSDVAQVFSAAQAPATVLFIKRKDSSIRALGGSASASLVGDGAPGFRATPVLVPSLSSATSIAIGSQHALARLADGTVLAWGNNASGQLGVVSGATAIPIPASSLTSVLSIAAIENASFAITGTGDVLSWGGAGPILGAGAAVTSRGLPGPVLTAAGTALKRAIAVVGMKPAGSAAGIAAAAAVDADGGIWTWGSAASGALGRTGGDPALATRLGAPAARFVALAQTSAGFIALTDQGQVYFWGTMADDAGRAVTVASPSLVQGVPRIVALQPAAPGLYQARLVDATGVRWAIDGLKVVRIDTEPQPDSSVAPVRDTTPPTLTLTDNVVGGTATGPFVVRFVWSEPVTGFEGSDVTVTGATAGPLTGSGAEYQMTITPAAGQTTGTAVVSVPVGAAADLAGNASTSAASRSRPFATASVSMRLTWGANPRDLDLTMVGPRSDTVINYARPGSLTAPPYMNLDRDDVDGEGPEIVLLTRVAPSRTYRISVNLFTGSGTIADSPARIVISGVVNAVIQPPAGTPTAWWWVADLVVDSACRVTIVPSTAPWQSVRPTPSVTASPNSDPAAYCIPVAGGS